MWSAERYKPDITVAQAQAIEICHQCPVIAECREWGMAHGNREFMILGGLHPLQRSRMARGTATGRAVPPFCLHCKKPMRPKNLMEPGYVRHYGRGYCDSCARLLRRQRRQLEEAS